jgi:hypothetical protein
MVLLITIYNLAYIIRKLRKDKWYFWHALPLTVYSVHVALFYAALLLRGQFPDADLGNVLMAWSIALRLHGAIMVMTMARQVVACRQS